MKQATKNLLGFFSLLPFLYPVAMFIVMLQIFIFSDTAATNEFPPELFMLGMVLGLFSVIIIAIFVAHAYKNPRLDSTNKIIWILILLLGNAFALPFYWFLQIRKS